MSQRHLSLPMVNRKRKKRPKIHTRPNLDWNKGGEIILKFMVLGSIFLLTVSFIVGGGILLFVTKD